MVFKVYSTIVLGQAQTYSQDLKLAHYMKVPLGHLTNRIFWYSERPTRFHRGLLSLVKSLLQYGPFLCGYNHSKTLIEALLITNIHPQPNCSDELDSCKHSRRM